MRRVSRLPLVAALAALLVAGLVAGNGARAPKPTPPKDSDPSSMPPAGARSSAWYCPGGPASDAVDVKEVVTITNLSEGDTVAAVTLMSSGSSRTSEEMAIPARGMVQVVPSEISGEAHVPVIVEPFAADVVVEQSLIADGEVELEPCATQPSARWYFAGGTTVRGTEQWLDLFNPFGDDAIVDVSFYTDEGVKAPESLHGVEVPRRSSVAIKVHETVRRQVLVATSVDARVGRVIAQQSQIFLPDSGLRGIAVSLGAIAPSVQWWFADGSGTRGQTRSIGIANPGSYDTEADVQVVADGDTVIEPVTVSVPRESAVEISLGGCGEGDAATCLRVPSGLTYSVLVSSANDVPLVARSIESWTDERAFTGATSTSGSRESTRRWVFGRVRIRDAEGASLSVVNPGSEPVSVDLTLTAEGEIVEPEEAQGLEVAPGERRVVDLLDLLDAAAPDAADAGLLVTSSAPIIAERLLTRSRAVTRSIGVPDRHWRSGGG